jgi:hypothetical protein
MDGGPKFPFQKYKAGNKPQALSRLWISSGTAAAIRSMMSAVARVPGVVKLLYAFGVGTSCVSVFARGFLRSLIGV